MAYILSATPYFTMVGNSPLVAGSISTSFSVVSGGNQAPLTHCSVQVVTTGAPTSYSMQVEVSHDNVSFFPMDGAITADGIYARSYVPISYGVGNNAQNPIQFMDHYPMFMWVRTHVTAVVGGTNPRYMVQGIAYSKFLNYYR